jgi:hypothetical protein
VSGRSGVGKRWGVQETCDEHAAPAGAVGAVKIMRCAGEGWALLGSWAARCCCRRTRAIAVLVLLGASTCKQRGDS